MPPTGLQLAIDLKDLLLLGGGTAVVVHVGLTFFAWVRTAARTASRA
jgi:hypothetical protein